MVYYQKKNTKPGLRDPAAGFLVMRYKSKRYWSSSSQWRRVGSQVRSLMM